MDISSNIGQLSALKQLEKLCGVMSAFSESTLKHECLNDDPPAAFVNTLVDIKELKQNFIDISSYSMFLAQFIKPIEEEVQERAYLSKIDEIKELAQSESRKYKEVGEKENSTSVAIASIDDQLKDIASWKEVASDVEKKQRKFQHLVSYQKKQLDSFPGQCTNSDDAEKMCESQKNLMREMQNELLVLNCFNTNLFSNIKQQEKKAITTVENLLSFTDSHNDESSVDSSTTDADHDDILNDVVIVSSKPDCDILEVFYTNVFQLRSSVEVVIKYVLNENSLQPSKSQISKISIKNCPINVDDLIDNAIVTSNMSCMLPELMYRLSQSSE